jgi:hypothetical protein
MPIASINTMIPWGYVRPVPPPRPFGSIQRVGTTSIGPMWTPLGQACPDCSIGTDIPECAGCVGGRPRTAGFWQRWGAPIALATATAVAATLAVAYVQRHRR